MKPEERAYELARKIESDVALLRALIAALVVRESTPRAVPIGVIREYRKR